MASWDRNWSPFLSLPHEPLARDKIETCARRLLRIGWEIKRQSSSYRTLTRPGWPDFVFAFHDYDEIGPRMLARIGKATGLTPDDL